MSLSPHIARTVAESTWPGVLNLDEIAPGLFWVVSKNHGGMLAAVDDLTTSYDVGEDAVQAAEAFGLIHSHADGNQSVRIWRGEEDVDWRTLVCASPAVHAAWVNSYCRPGALSPGYSFDTWVREQATLEQLQDELRFWRPTYPQAIPSSPTAKPGPTPAPELATAVQPASASSSMAAAASQPAADAATSRAGW
ncbi:hypothetical protein [Kineococcus sp. R86509]|uniref:hypothetical protein n=1 Tax=Kineococcus sp. R86509 TaxID=3093851 RepID=UPI0036D2A0E0